MIVLLISVDLGYGFTKTVSEKSKVIFPSVMAAGSELDLGLGSKKAGHLVQFRPAGSTVRQQFFVGELAVREGRAAQITLAREKFAHEVSLLLTFTAAYLAGGEGQVTLAYGLPVAYYGHQKDAVRAAFQGKAAYMSVDGGPERYISLSAVYVFPQGVGALFSAESLLPKEGSVGLIDVGYYTTDYLLVELDEKEANPLSGYTSSVELGVSTAMKLFAETFQRKTGKPLSLADAQVLWAKKQVSFAGSKVNVEPMVEGARKAAGDSIVETVRAAWSEKIDFIDQVLLAGGGAVEFMSVLSGGFFDVQLIPDAQFANAIGFYKMGQKVCSPGKQDATTV